MKSQRTRIDKDKFGPWAIVTGASSGLGKEFARQLAWSGLNVVLVARRLAELEEVGRGLAKEFGVQYRAVRVDLADEDLLDRVEEATHDLDVGVVISNAGAGIPGQFLTIERGALLRIVRLNVIAHLDLVHHFGRKLAQRGRGGVLLVSAFGGHHGLPFMANDAATKSYVLSLGEGLHVEFRKLGLNVTVLLPGPTDTPVLAKLGFNPDTMRPKPMAAEQCVAEGLAALNANHATHIAGRMNRIMDAVIPRPLAIRMGGRMIGKIVAERTSRANA